MNNRCEWCEERRYVPIGQQKLENGVLYCLDLHNDENGYFMEILKQRPPRPIWEVKYRKKIKYCPFCGRKLEEIE